MCTSVPKPRFAPFVTVATGVNGSKSGDNKLPGRLVVGLALASLALPLSLLVGWLTYKANRFLNPKTALPSLLQKVPSLVSVVDRW